MAEALFHHLGRAGILTRVFAKQRDWLRFGLPGSTQEWRRVRAAMERWQR